MGGTLTDSGGAVTNDGTVKLAKATVFQLQEAATFANKSDGTIVTDIAGTRKASGSWSLPVPAVPGRASSLRVATFSLRSSEGKSQRPTAISNWSCSRGAPSAEGSSKLATASRPTTPTSPRALRSWVPSITAHRARTS